MAVLGGGGGGAGDTYTASTATAKNVIEAGKSYALTSDGGIVTPPAGTIAQVGGFVTEDMFNNMENSVSIYGDVFLPDAETSGAYFVLVADGQSAYNGYLLINKNGQPVSSGSSGVYFNLSTQWTSVGSCSLYLVQYGETTDNWYYGLMGMKDSSYWRSGWYTFGVDKSTHQILNSNYANPYTTTWDSWDDGNSSNVIATTYMSGNSNNKMLFSSLRGGNKLIRARGNAYDDDHEVYVETANLEASTSSNNYNMYTSSSGSLTITPTEDGHCAFFKVDDANGTFIFLFTKDGDGGFSYHHGSTPASGSTTYSSEIDVSGTLGTNMQYAHFIATANPLVYYATYLDSSTTMYYQKITFASDLASASMATMGSFTVPGGYGSYSGGTSYWARYYHQNSNRASARLNIPGDETLLIWGTSYPASDTGRTLLFPASGTPSDGGANSINNDFDTASGASLKLTLTGDGKNIVAHQHGQSETEGYEMVSAQKYAPYKHTVDKVAIARAAGNVGDTINIDLKTGDTATAALSTDFYVTKESMVYPLKVAGSDTTYTTAIKSIQRGTGYSSSQSTVISISSVNKNKSQLVMNGWNSSQNKGITGVLTSGSQITVTKSNSYSYGYSYAWEVVEYV